MSAEVSGARPLFGIYGTGGCGRSVLPVAESMLSLQHGAGGYDLVYVDDVPPGASLNGRPVLKFDEFLAVSAPSRAVSIAVANSADRRRLDERCRDRGVSFFHISAPNVVVMDDVSIDDGAVLSPFVTITSNVRIGRHFHANLYSYVEHDCTIGDFVTFAPSVHCNGNVVIQDHAYLGSACVLRQGTPEAPLVIGEGAVVGMGAVVTRSVPPGITVVGNPARPLQES